MTEPTERISALEANMSNVLSILSKREDYQNNVLVKLTTIELKQDQAIQYQKTCDAERNAHASRLNTVEDAIKKMAEVLEKIEDHARRITSIEKRITRSNTAWWLVLKIAGVFGGIGAFAAAIATVLTARGHP